MVQVCALVVFCAPLLAVGWGLIGQLGGGATAPEVALRTPAEGAFFGTLSSSTAFGLVLLDPFAVLQIAAASKSFDVSWLVGALPVLVAYGLVRGRAFCGWVCPVNLLCEGLDWLHGKFARAGRVGRAGRAVRGDVREGAREGSHEGVRSDACEGFRSDVRSDVHSSARGFRVGARGGAHEGVYVPRHAKLVFALVVLALSAATSIPVFEVVSPVSALNKGLVLGSLAGVWTLAGIVVVDLFLGRRVWCRSVCPLGGFYEVLGRVGLVNVHIDANACIRCDACARACLADPQILEPALSGEDVIVRAGDCMACGACVDACPAGALSLRVGRPRKAALTSPDGRASSANTANDACGAGERGGG